MTRLAHAPALIPMSDEAFACHSAVGTGAFTVVHEAQTAKRFMSHSRYRDGAGLPLAGTLSMVDRDKHGWYATDSLHIVAGEAQR